MRKNKSELYLALFIIATVAGTILVYTQAQEENASGIFPEKLGDMSLSLYREGDVAMTEVKNLHRGANVEIENAFIANYRSPAGNKAKFWISESKNSGEAALLLAAMNSRVGKTGMFSESMPVSVEDITVYFVTGQPELGLYHYFYAKDKRVFWIQIDNPDEAYRTGIVKESIKRI